MLWAFCYSQAGAYTCIENALLSTPPANLSVAKPMAHTLQQNMPAGPMQGSCFTATLAAGRTAAKPCQRGSNASASSARRYPLSVSGICSGR